MKKKVLISCSYAGSLINFRGKLIQELLKEHEVYAFVPDNYSPQINEVLTNWGVRVYTNRLTRNTVSFLGDIQYMIQLYKVIKEIKPDFFFAYTFKPIIYGSLVASFCRVKQICSMLTGLGYTFEERSGVNLVQQITKRLLKFSLKSNKNMKIIFQNEDNYNQLISSRIIDENHHAFVVNGSGVDLSHYNFSEPNVDKITFLMIARLVKAKGIQEFYDAAVKVKSKHPGVCFKLVGPEDLGIDSISDDLKKKLESEVWVEYYGSRSDVRPFIEEASVVVLPSYHEGTPRSLLEAMSMGRAIITTTASGCRETVNPDPEKANGFAVPVKNSDAIAARMEFYIKHPQKIIEHGKNGREYAEERYDVNKVNQQMLQIFALT